MEKKYETIVSNTYEATSPEDAARQFINNLCSPDTDWFIHVREIGTFKEFTVDTADYSAEPRN